MSRAVVFVAVCALALATAAAGALSDGGVLVPDRSLGGIHLGETAGGVRAALGSAYGVCRGCARPTWYFTSRPFENRGLAVELTRGRVSAVYTLWQPEAWRTARGLRLGAAEGQVTKLAGVLVPISCSGYSALVRNVHGAQTAYYIVDSKLWGFGLLRSTDSPCR